jgi:HAE1 family hydrophobic/amphiphilic exporter-1
MAKNFTLGLLKRRNAIIVLTIIMTLIGILAVTSIQVMFYPPMRKPTILLTVSSSGYTAADLYTRYSDDLDLVIGGIDEAEKVTAEYGSGFIRYSIEFPWQYDFNEAKDKVMSISPRVKAVFPDDDTSNFKDPIISFATAQSANFTAALYSDGMNNEQLYLEAKNILETAIKRNVIDIDTLTIIPVQQLVAKVEFDVATMLSLGLMPDNVISKVKEKYLDVSMGSFRDKNLLYAMSNISEMTNLYALGELSIATVNGESIKLGDVATITFKKELPYGTYLVNGNTAVLLSASAKAEGNLLLMTQNIKKQMKQNLPNFSQKVSMSMIEDPSQFIIAALKNVLSSILQGSLLAIIITWLFLGVFRNTIIVAISLPLSLIFTFIPMKIFNVSINLISLSGLALAVGMTVDAALVVMENIDRHRKNNMKLHHPAPLSDVVSYAVDEVRFSVIAGLITSICVFLPLTFTAPLANALLGSLALVVVFALCASLLVAFIIIPIISYYLFRNQSKGHIKKSPYFLHKIEQFSHALNHAIEKPYKKILHWLLHSHRAYYKQWLVIVVCLALLGLSFVLFGKLKVEIIAAPSSKQLTIKADNTARLYTEIPELIDALVPVEAQIRHIVGDHLTNLYVSTSNPNIAYYGVTLDKSRYTESMVDQLNRELGLDNWTFTARLYDPAALPLPPIYALHLRINGPDRIKILGYLEQLQDAINQMTENKTDPKTGLPKRLYQSLYTWPTTRVSNEIALSIRPETVIKLGIDQESLNTFARLYLSGSSMTIPYNGEDVPISFKFPPIYSREQALNILVPYNNIGIPLSHFYDITSRQNISSIIVEDEHEVYNLYGLLDAKEMNPSRMKKLESRVQNEVLKKFVMEPGYTISILDGQRDMREAIQSLGSVLILSIILIFLVLAIQFNSYILPLIIIVTIPLGFIGAILSLFLLQSSMSINSVLGIILLGGISVNNSIMIVDFYLNMPHDMPKHEAIAQASLMRITPILSSVSTTVLGMLPIALALGDGSNVVQPLGIAVSGGLLFSTLATLLIIPSILALIKRPHRDSILE